VGWRDRDYAMQLLRDDRATWLREVDEGRHPGASTPVPSAERR
jgi:hypothetical protein